MRDQNPVKGNTGLSETQKTILLRQQSNTRILATLVDKLLSELRAKTTSAELPQILFTRICNTKNSLKSLDLAAYPPAAKSYKKYIAYCHNESRISPFSFTMIVFGPQQKTPHHSHRVDCAPLCLQGLIRETLFSHPVKHKSREEEGPQQGVKAPGDANSVKSEHSSTNPCKYALHMNQNLDRPPKEHLIARKSKIYRPFEGCYLPCNKPNTHLLENVHEGISVTMNLYLYNPQLEPDQNSSIFEVYR